MRKTHLIKKMNDDEKGIFIKDNWNRYKRYCRMHDGKPYGFKFPDGSRIVQGEGKFLYF